MDFKSRSLQLPAAPLLLENQGKGGYAVELKPEIAAPTFTFNATSADLDKRKVFGDLRFRQAMSLAVNRDEINKVAFFDPGMPQPYAVFSPPPDFVDKKWANHMAQHDPANAKALLDAVGLNDTDGDSFRELPNGKKLVLSLQFATQGMAGRMFELAGRGKRAYGNAPTAEDLARCIDHINRFVPRPAVVLATGDIANGGLPEEAERAPGYRLHYRSPDRNLVTHTVHVRESDGPYPFEGP